MENIKSYYDYTENNFFLYLSENPVKDPREDFYEHKFMIDNYSEFADYTQEEMFTKVMNGAYAYPDSNKIIYCYDNNCFEKIGSAYILLESRAPRILEIDSDFCKTMCNGFAYIGNDGKMKLDFIDLVKNKGFDGIHIAYSYCVQYYYNMDYAKLNMSFPVSYGADKYLFYNMDWVYAMKRIDLDDQIIVRIPTFEWDNYNAFYEYLDIETEDRQSFHNFSFFDEHDK